MAALAVDPKTMESGDVVQWQNSLATLTDLRTLLGAGNVIADQYGGTSSIEIVLDGVRKTVNHLDYVFVGTTDFAVLTPAEFARYYEEAA